MNYLAKILKSNDVETIYFCSGSRNSSLLDDLDSFFNVVHCFEERQASFMALGETKITNKPVVVCTTSGTAVLECISALAEAFYSNEKLLILSADRPSRLFNSAAPQTIDQLSPLRAFVKTQINTTIAKLDEKISLQFPAQINLQIDDTTKTYESNLDFVFKDQFASFLANKRALFLLTDGYFKSELEKVAKSIIKNNHFLYVDKSANVSIDGPSILSQDIDCQNILEQKLVDCVVRIGHTPLVKLWRDLDRLYVDIDVFHIDPRGFQALARGSVWKADNLIELDEIINRHQLINSEYINSVRHELIAKFNLSEVNWFQKIADLMAEDSFAFIGNSMPIRYWQMVQTKKSIQTFCSRGANGIDGQISTAIGISQKTSKKVYAIFGDLTCLYDIGSLVTSLPKNLQLIVVNNMGGRIFELVGKSGNIINEHKHKISDLVAGFKISSCMYDDPSKLKLDEQLIEIFPSVEQTRLFWKEWKNI